VDNGEMWITRGTPRICYGDHRRAAMHIKEVHIKEVHIEPTRWRGNAGRTARPSAWTVRRSLRSGGGGQAEEPCGQAEEEAAPALVLPLEVLAGPDPFEPLLAEDVAEDVDESEEEEDAADEVDSDFVVSALVSVAEPFAFSAPLAPARESLR
jgi:hypothetical protein